MICSNITIFNDLTNVAAKMIILNVVLLLGQYRPLVETFKTLIWLRIEKLKLPNGPTSIYQSEVFSFWNNAKIHGWISPDSLTFYFAGNLLGLFFIVFQRFTKVFCPIVAQTNALLSPLGKYVDFSIKMFVHLLSYIRDSTDLLIKIGCVWSTEDIFVTHFGYY